MLNYWTDIIPHCRGFCSPLNGPPGRWGPFLQSCFPAGWSPPNPGAGIFTSPYWAWWGCCSPISPACWSPSGLHHDPLLFQSCIISKLVEITLFPIIQIIKDGNKKNHTQYWLTVYPDDPSNQFLCCRSSHSGLSHSANFQFTSLTAHPTHTSSASLRFLWETVLKTWRRSR